MVYSGLIGQLGQGPVVIEAGHRGKITRIQVRRGSPCNQCIGVGRISHNQHLDVTTGDLVHRSALRTKNLAVGGNKIFPFHAGTARLCADQQGVVRILKSSLGIICRYHILE